MLESLERYVTTRARQGYTDHVVIGPGQIFGYTSSAVNQGVNVTNVNKVGLFES